VVLEAALRGESISDASAIFPTISRPVLAVLNTRPLLRDEGPAEDDESSEYIVDLLG